MTRSRCVPGSVPAYPQHAKLTRCFDLQIVRGTYKGREGVVTTCQRKNFRIFVEGVSRDKGNGATVPIGVNASNVVINKLKLDKDRKNILSRKGAAAKKSEDVEMKAVSPPGISLLRELVLTSLFVPSYRHAMPPRLVAIILSRPPAPDRHFSRLDAFFVSQRRSKPLVHIL